MRYLGSLPGRGSSMGDSVYFLIAVSVVLIFVFPLYWGLSTSLRAPMDTFTVTGLGIPGIHFDPTLNNWLDQLVVPEMRKSIFNSIVISISSSFLALALGIPSAYALARFQFKLIQNRDITIWFLSQRVLPPVATVIPFYIVLQTFSLLDTHLALILINTTFTLPFAVVIMRQAFLDLPIELEEASMMDGARHFGAFWRIALPLSAPAVTATALIIFAFTWNELLFALVLSSKNAITIPMFIAGSFESRGVQFWFLSVRTMIAMIIPIFIALLAQRYIVRGLTLGAVKG